MIRLTTSITEKLATLAFNYCDMKNFLDVIEEIIVNPLSFSIVKNFYDPVKSKSFIESYEKNLPPKENEAREKYVLGRMTQLKDEPLITQGGPGIKYGNIICWAVENDTTYGLIVIQGSKIPLKTIDLALVKFIAQCIAHIAASEKRRQWQITPEYILSTLLQDRVHSYSHLTSISGELKIKRHGEYKLVVIKFPPHKALHASPYIMNYIETELNNSWCTCNNKNLVVLMYREDITEPLAKLVKSFDSTLCIGSKFYDIMDTKHQYEYILSLLNFSKDSKAGIIYYDNYPEFTLLHKAKIPQEKAWLLCSEFYLKLLEYDQNSKTNYIQIIRALIQYNFNVTKASKSLGIHPNSITYRLGKLEERFGVDIRLRDSIYEFMFSENMMKYSGGKL